VRRKGGFGMTYCPARSDPVANPNPPHIELIIPALDVEVLTTTVKYTGLSSAPAVVHTPSIGYVHVKHLQSAQYSKRELKMCGRQGDSQKHH